MSLVKARIYSSTSISTSPTIFIVVQTKSAKKVIYICVSHAFLSSYLYPELWLHCCILFLLPWKLILLWLMICHIFAIFFFKSIQFWCSPFVQSLLFPFYYLSFHLSSHLYKDSSGNKFFISFLFSRIK